MPVKRPAGPPLLVLSIMDGWGISDIREGNAIAQAALPTLDRFYSRYPWTTLEASGTRVGLPDNQMGNSEVGHINLGAGRVVRQFITRIGDAIQSGEFFKIEEIRRVLETARRSKLHLMGLVSDGGVHSHLDHLVALLRFARTEGVQEVFIHAFTDGRDTSPKGGLGFLRRVQEEAGRIGVGQIASVSGRYFAMDRDNRWPRTEKAYRAIVEGDSPRRHKDPLAGIEASYLEGVTDEFLVPFAVVDGSGHPAGRLEEDHAVIFFNFRADRARQLTRALADEEFPHFARSGRPVRCLLTMTEYDRTFGFPMAFPPRPLDRTLAKVFGAHDVPNLRIAETEKYAHVTYFFNCGEEQPFPQEKRILVPSPQVATYDLKPEMSAFEITDRLLEEIRRDTCRIVILNFANADMVGHTGVMPAAIKAVETVDTCLGEIQASVREKGGIMMVTADHGNAEEMIDPRTGEIHTAHTTNPVPFILVDDRCQTALRSGGALEDVAPTMLHYLGVERPSEMTGRSLLSD